jgi:hypothetical protein
MAKRDTWTADQPDLVLADGSYVKQMVMGTSFGSWSRW